MNIGWYLRDYSRFLKFRNTDFPLGKPLPVLTERSQGSGNLSGHYFHQDLWVAQQIFLAHPDKHVDVGSRTDGFVTHVASYRELEVLDIRPAEKPVRNITFRQADIMAPDSALQGYTDSLSCLHVIEHFGLGRYGDHLDLHGHEKGWEHLYGMLKKDGIFYFSTPIGPQRIEFNAHRVFSLQYLLQWMEGKYEILQFNYVDDQGDFFEDIELTEEVVDSNANCHFGCGIFKLKKV